MSLMAFVAVPIETIPAGFKAEIQIVLGQCRQISPFLELTKTVVLHFMNMNYSYVNNSLKKNCLLNKTD